MRRSGCFRGGALTGRMRAVWLVMLISMAGCGGPPNFVKSPEVSWAAVSVRPDITYDRAWDALIGLLVRHFDMEVLSKEDGYLRTTWYYRWTGKLTEDYRVRVIAKFNTDRTACEVKAEAEYGGPGEWVMGTDTRLLQEVQGAMLGTIGSSVR
jgi:hypothetical protein